MADVDFFSHGTALVLRGAPTPANWDEVIHVSGIRPRNPARTEGVVSHRLAVRRAAHTKVGGLLVEHPARAWVQASTHLTDVELIVAADYLVARRRRLTTLLELYAEAKRRPRLGGLLERVREGSESSQETKLRLAIVDGGLPEPELAHQLHGSDGRLIARLDQAYLEYRVGVEYDGRQHAEDARQFARDADRWREIGESGWLLVRILKHHLEPDPSVAVKLVRDALVRAGWRR
jgi:very-short-patch-repair endonuclease